MTALGIPEDIEHLLAIAYSDWDVDIVDIDETAIDAFLEKASFGVSITPPPLPSNASAGIEDKAVFLIHVCAQLYRFWWIDPQGQLQKFRYNNESGSSAMFALYGAHWHESGLDVNALCEDLRWAPDGDYRVEIAREVDKAVPVIRQKVIGRIFEQAESGGVTVADASLLAHNCPKSYQDAYLKKAQLAVSLIGSAYCQGRGIALNARLTAFADYQVPRVLRALDILQYAPELAEKVDSYTPLLCNGADERCLRGATVVACQVIAERSATPVHLIDNMLWSHQHLAKGAPFHLTYTSNY